MNDLSPEACSKVVQEIQQAGGKAAAAPGSVTEGDQIVAQAVKAFGTVHILINNAGVLRDKSFKKMSDQDFDIITAVHLKGAFACTKACWPIFRGQKVCWIGTWTGLGADGFVIVWSNHQHGVRGRLVR